jgi:signal peptidase II
MASLDKAFWKRFGLVAAVFAINYGLDRATKLIAEATLRGAGTRSYLGGFFLLVYTQNDGAFLSMGSLWPLALKYAVFIVLPLAVCLYGLWYCLFRRLRTSWTVIIVTIIAGGVGNLQDRVFNSFHVVDFMNFGIGNFRTGILNVGDMSVTFGAIALAIAVWLADRRGETGTLPDSEGAGKAGKAGKASGGAKGPSGKPGSKDGAKGGAGGRNSREGR